MGKEDWETEKERKVREEEDLKGRGDRSEEDERGTEEEKRREGRKKMRIGRGRG